MNDWGASALQRIIQAGDDIYDIAAVHGAGAFSLAQSNFVLDWFENMPYVDFDAPWWSDDAIKNLAAFGRLYCVTGDITHLGLASTQSFLFNKDLFANLGLDYPYQDVLNGTWTLDKFIGLTKSAPADLNGDGQITPDADRFGLFMFNEWTYPISVLYSGGDRVITIDGGGTPELTIYNPRTVDIFDKFFDMMNTDGAAYIPGISHSAAIDDMFTSGRSLFYAGVLSDVIKLRDMENEIGILPHPKYDANVPLYYSLVDAGQNVFVVPITAENTERTSIIVEALAAEGYKNIMPAFYEISLKTKHARDDESSAMIDFIRAGRIFDYGYYNNSVTGDLAYAGQRLVTGRNQNFTSFFERNETRVQRNIERLMED